MPRGLLIFLLFVPAISHARVFNYKDAGVAAYVRGEGGLSALGQDAFANSSGSDTSVSGKSNYNYGGELGFMFGLSPNFHLRLAAEVLQEHPVVGDGLAPDGTSRFSLNSSVFVFNPNLAFEYVYSTKGSVRLYAEAGVGYATINVSNVYKMTAAGTSALGGVTDFTETLGGTALSEMAGVGMETLFTDNVTFMADVGYRYLPVKTLTYSSAVNNIVSPSGVKKGDPVLNQDGSKRTLNLSGVYAGVSFRFYLNFF